MSNVSIFNDTIWRVRDVLGQAFETELTSVKVMPAEQKELRRSALNKLTQREYGELSKDELNWIQSTLSLTDRDYWLDVAYHYFLFAWLAAPEDDANG